MFLPRRKTPEVRLAPEELGCNWCAVPLDREGRCPQCGRRQVKVCLCGEELSFDQDLCPGCGADWNGVVKVIRRRRRNALSNMGVLQAAGVGVLVALVVTAITIAVVNKLAWESAEQSTLPESPVDRLGLAWRTVCVDFHDMGKAFRDHAGITMYLLLFGGVGALIGVFVYLRRVGAFTGRRRGLPVEPPPGRRKHVR